MFHPFQFMDVLKIDVGSMFDSMFHQYDPSIFLEKVRKEADVPLKDAENLLIFPRKSAEAEESQPLSSEVPEGGDSGLVEQGYEGDMPSMKVGLGAWREEEETGNGETMGTL